MPKKLTQRKERKAVAIKGRKSVSMNMPATRKLIHAKPSPRAIMAIV